MPKLIQVSVEDYLESIDINPENPIVYNMDNVRNPKLDIKGMLIEFSEQNIEGLFIDFSAFRVLRHGEEAHIPLTDIYDYINQLEET